MFEHFGLKMRDSTIGYKLTRENYVQFDNKSIYGFSDENKDYYRYRLIKCLINFDYNMDFFKSLDKNKFNYEIEKFLNVNSRFKLVTDLNQYKEKKGAYLIILDDYCQAYIGISNNISKRIRDHWINQKPFDRLIFGSVENSIISIDSFRALDTTRIYVHLIDEPSNVENGFINNINPIYLCNRTIGGILDCGLTQAMFNAKNRQFIVKKMDSNITIAYEDNLSPLPVQLHEIYMKIRSIIFTTDTNYEYVDTNIIKIKFDGKYGTYTIVIDQSELIVKVVELS